MALRMLTTISLFYFIIWGLAWIEIHWNSIWLRAWSHMTSHYTWGSVTTLHDFGGVLRQPLDTFFGALTISWSRLLAYVQSGPYVVTIINFETFWLIFMNLYKDEVGFEVGPHCLTWSNHSAGLSLNSSCIYFFAINSILIGATQ